MLAGTGGGRRAGSGSRSRRRRRSGSEGHREHPPRYTTRKYTTIINNQELRVCLDTLFKYEYV